jgi:hypothetical protein
MVCTSKFGKPKLTHATERRALEKVGRYLFKYGVHARHYFCEDCGGWQEGQTRRRPSNSTTRWMPGIDLQPANWNGDGMESWKRSRQSSNGFPDALYNSAVAP